MPETEIVVASANIAGAMRAGKAHPQKFQLLASGLAKHNPDIIGFQEVIRVPGAARDDLRSIQNSLPGPWVPDFFPHLDSHVQSHPGKWASPIFRGYFSSGRRILQGTGVLVKVSHSLLNVWGGKLDSSSQGRTVGQFMPIPDTIYCGNRDTEPRSLLMTRVKISDKTVLFCCTQLSTLKEEDQKKNGKNVRIPTPRAIARREEQVRWIVEYLKSYQKELGEIEPIILVGDFNCEPDANEFQPLYNFGFAHAHLGSPADWPLPSGWSACPTPPHTHRERFHADTTRKILIDHVFVKQASVKEAYIVDLEPIEINSGTAGTISDHHPVVVKLSL
jgi:endonuclease/exonuclease/phosphatase family metal-dependent hydrolase